MNTLANLIVYNHVLKNVAVVQIFATHVLECASEYVVSNVKMDVLHVIQCVVGGAIMLVHNVASLTAMICA